MKAEKVIPLCHYMTKIGNELKKVRVMGPGKPYTHTNGRKSLVFRCYTPAGNVIERYNQQLRECKNDA